MLKTLLLANLEATEKFAQELAHTCSPGTVIFLKGQLGAGKTTLIRSFLRAKGITGPIKSPTYTLVEPYFVNNQHYYHFDLYRLEDPQELENIGLRDYFDGHSICLIEWPERAISLLPEPDIICELSVSETGRQLIVSRKS